MVKEETKEREEKLIKPIFTSRLLFISVLDKIYLIILILLFLGATGYNFAGNIGSLSYGFWTRVGREILIVVALIVCYYLFNWFYKCASKTMLCLTKNEVYKEEYIPFKRTESSIPLNKITKVTTINVFWIFRTLIIHQYGKLPTVFFTWTNQEFKDHLNVLITGDKDKIENEYVDKNLIGKEMYKYLQYAGLALVAIIGFIGVIRFFGFIFNSERKIAGTYTNDNKEFVLKSDGSCNIYDLNSKAEKCSWSYDKDDKTVNIDYEYEEYSWYLGYETEYGSYEFTYNSDNKTLTRYEAVYKKN